MKTALYPGTFDPVTNGHIDIMERATHLFDKVIVATPKAPYKKTLFSADERMELIKENVKDHPAISIISFEGLIVDIAKEIGAVALIRGLRALGDFEYEFEMAQMNRHLNSSIETVFLMTNEKFFFTSSTMVKQVSRYSVRDTKFVPANVLAALRHKFENGEKE